MDLTKPSDRVELTAMFLKDLDAASIKELDEDDFRNHLGASVIGKPCRRKAWLTFRWAKKEQFEGRMLRLFNRGHEEEARNFRWLRAAGFDCRDLDPNTGKQFRISACHGHFGGSSDGMAIAPAKYGFNAPIGLEFKTQNKNQWAQLEKKGVHAHFPEHVAQMACYGAGLQYEWTLYLGVCKDNDAIWPEWVRTDMTLANMMLAKATEVIYSQEPLPKISEHPTFLDCKRCTFAGICHYGQAPVINCRTCKFALPAPDAEWFCAHHNGIIPAHIIKTGCGSPYLRII